MRDSASQNKPISAFDLVSLVLSQMPVGLVFAGFDKFSVYQPSFYRGKELFLLIPLLIGAFSTWAIMRSHRAMYWIFPIGIIFGVTNFLIFEFVSLESRLHTINWILSYCTYSLIVAILARALGELLGWKDKL